MPHHRQGACLILKVPLILGIGAQLTAMDDFTELHLVEMMAVCSDECAAMPQEYTWLYMCAVAKALACSFACSGVVYDLARPVLNGGAGLRTGGLAGGTAGVGLGADGHNTAAR
jgi:hypothetical protein|eukprot:COSAG06_NODE_3759_length_4938_cov_2.241785_1_plen_114_part_00